MDEVTIINSQSQIINPYGLWPEELEIIEPRTVQPIVDWAPEHLIIPSKESPKLSGYFDWQYSPHLREPCNWFNDPMVRRITIRAGLQRGKTLYMMLCLCWVIANAPGPTMLVMTDENTLRRRMKRIRPLFGANDYLLAKLGGREENLFLGELTDLGDMMLALAWAGSAAMLSDFPIQYEFLDELVLWQQTLQNLSLDPMALLRGRQNTHAEDSKTVTVSSSGNVGDLLDVEYEDGDRCEYWMECPKCGWWQIPYWHRKEQPGCYVVLDRDKSGDWLPLRAYEDGKHARYVCPSCMHPWTDYARVEALQGGRWLPDGITMDRSGTPSAEVLPTAYKSATIRSVMVHPRLGSLGKMAADWVRGQIKIKAGDASGLKYFLNNHEAQAWREREETTEAELLRKRIGQYEAGIIPWGVQRLTAGVDVQKDHVFLRVLGWGYMSEVWSIFETPIECGDTSRIENWEKVLAQIVQRFPVSWDKDRVMRISKVAVDCGYNTDTVIDFVRQCQGLVDIVPVRGDDSVTKSTYRKSKVAGGTMYRYDLCVDTIKDRLFRLYYLSETPGPGYGHLHAETSTDVIEQLTSEEAVLVRRGAHNFRVWQPKKGARRNHYWDCDVYAAFAAELEGYRSLPPLEDFEKQVQAESRPTKAEPPATTRKIRAHY